MSENEKSNVSFLESIKKSVNKAKVSNLTSNFMVFVMIVILSFWSVGWSVDEIDLKEFLLNLAILLFVGIYGLFAGQQIGTNHFKTNILGAYQVARESLISIIRKIFGKGFVDYLSDYIPYRYQKDCEKAYNMKLLSVKLFHKHVLDLSDEEIEKLKVEAIKKEWEDHSPHKGKIEYFSKLSEEQYKVVKDIREGRVVVEYIEDSNYYLGETSQEEKQIISYVINAEQMKLKVIKKHRLARVGQIVIVSLILAGLARDSLTQSMEQAILLFASRLFTLAMSTSNGVNTAKTINMIDVKVLKYKVSYLEMFCSAMENKTFVPIDYNEKAREEFEIQEKEKESKEEIIHGEESNAIERTE